MKKIAILGSTGSIGTQTLEVARENGDLQITALAAGNNIELLEKQIREFHPGLVAVWKEEKAKELKDRVKEIPNCIEIDLDNEIYNGNSSKPNVDIKMNDLSYIIYTSGSTGVPKGVMLNQVGLANMAKAMGINESQLNIKATTEEKLGFTGREEGIASQAICLLNERKES